jgi:hypothetical protein
MGNSKCRFCGTKLSHTFIDLGMSPLANSYIRPEDLQKGEKFYPLHAYVCENCFLVQLEEFETPQAIFSDYAYFSSYSVSWLQHSKNYVEMITERLGLTSKSQVMEVASNDGYLLQYFLEKGIPVLGIEPAENVAKIAEAKGIKTLAEFFGVETAKKITESEKKADLLIGNNVLAHVPDINDFVDGMKYVLNKNGMITMEFPHLLNLIRYNQFDTIYHEHFSYLSFTTVKAIFEHHGLKIIDVDKLPTHGGSIRIFAVHRENNNLQPSGNVGELLDEEKASEMTDLSLYQRYSESVKKTKRNILEFFIREKNNGKSIAAYGAPAKGNTLLNYCGIRDDMIDYTVDRSPHKQGTFLPGTRIEVKSVEEIKKTKPDYLIILPWNLKEEIMEQNNYIIEWGGKFVTLIPEVNVL